MKSFPNRIGTFSIMNRNIILILGAPGVGKTTMIEKFISRNGNFLRLSGGSLLKPELSENERDTLRITNKDSILSNQKILAKKFKEELEKHPDKEILFDGHILINNERELIPIPFEIIQSLKPTKIIYLSAPPEEIIERRVKDHNRPLRSQETLKELIAYTSKALDICSKYSEKLSIPLIHLKDSSLDNFV